MNARNSRLVLPPIGSAPEPSAQVAKTGTAETSALGNRSELKGQLETWMNQYMNYSRYARPLDEDTAGNPPIEFELRLYGVLFYLSVSTVSQSRGGFHLSLRMTVYDFEKHDDTYETWTVDHEHWNDKHIVSDIRSRLIKYTKYDPWQRELVDALVDRNIRMEYNRNDDVYRARCNLTMFLTFGLIHCSFEIVYVEEMPSLNFYRLYASNDPLHEPKIEYTGTVPSNIGNIIEYVMSGFKKKDILIKQRTIEKNTEKLKLYDAILDILLMVRNGKNDPDLWKLLGDIKTKLKPK